jgi:hypothetical protein
VGAEVRAAVDAALDLGAVEEVLPVAVGVAQAGGLAALSAPPKGLGRAHVAARRALGEDALDAVAEREQARDSRRDAELRALADFEQAKRWEARELEAHAGQPMYDQPRHAPAEERDEADEGGVIDLAPEAPRNLETRAQPEGGRRCVIALDTVKVRVAGDLTETTAGPGDREHVERLQVAQDLADQVLGQRRQGERHRDEAERACWLWTKKCAA